MAVKELFVAIIGDSKSLERAFTRSTAAANKFGRDVDTGVGRAEARFSKFQKVAAGGFVGGLIAQQAVTAIRSVVVAASESQQVLGQTKVALEAAGLSWENYGKQIEDTVRAQSKLGFDDEALLRTFSGFVRGNKDVALSLRENALAADISRARFIDLETAAKLVQKAALGQAGALRRLGIDTKGATTGTELLALLTEKYGGAAKAASTDATTAFDRVQVSTENLKESIGSALLPSISRAATAFAGLEEEIVGTIDAMKKLSKVKVPTIVIPFTTKRIGGEGGLDLGGIGKSIAGFGLKGLGFIPQTAPLARAIELQLQITAAKAEDAAKEEASRQTTILGNKFADSLNTMLSGALTLAQTKIVPPTPTTNAGGKTGFGFGLTPQDLFGPLIKGITAAQEEALLDAQISGNQSRIRGVLVKIQAGLTAALDDPRLKRPGRIQIKQAIEAVTGQIEAIDAAAQSASDAASSKADAKARANRTKAQQRQRARFDAIIGTLTTQENAAELSHNFLRAIKVENKIQAAIKNQIKVEGRTAELVGDLSASREKEAAAVKGRKLAKDFRLLGLGKTGEELIPGQKSLQVQFDRITKNVDKGTIKLGGKLTKQLAGVATILSRHSKKLAPEIATAIQAIFDAITGTIDKNTKTSSGPLTKTSSLNVGKILDGLGLGRDTEKELRARLSSFNSAGKQLAGATRPTGSFGGGTFAKNDVVINLTTMLDGQVVAQTTSKHQVAAARRNPAQKRGMNRAWGP